MSNNSSNGIFIVFEGIDGSGKGTLIELLDRHLEALGFPAIRTKCLDPDRKLGAMYRNFLFEQQMAKHKPDDVVASIFFSDHVDHADHVAKNLACGYAVLADRYRYCHTAYQSQRKQHPMLSEQFRQYPAPEPDLLFLLHGTPQNLLARANSRTAETHQEGKAWNEAGIQQRIQDEYVRELGGKSFLRIVPVDMLPAEEIYELYIKPEVIKLLKSSGRLP